MITTQSPTGSQWSTPTLAREITSSDTMDENESGEADWDYSHAAAPVVPGLGQESHTMGRLQIFLEAAELASSQQHHHSCTFPGRVMAQNLSSCTNIAFIGDEVVTIVNFDVENVEQNFPIPTQ